MEKNFRIKIIYITALLISMLTLLFFYIKEKSRQEEKTEIINPLQKVLQQKPLSADELKKILPGQIDSIMFVFGIKKEWIRETQNFFGTKKSSAEEKSLTLKSSEKSGKEKSSAKKQKGNKEIKPEKRTTVPDNSSANLWFSKEVNIPKDLSVAEVNLELAKHMSELGFSCSGNENPKDGNILLNIYHTIDSSKKTLATINFIINEKIKRDAADICLILEKVEDMTVPQLEKILASTEKFSVVMPDPVNNIDAQTVVLDSKRDFVIFADIGADDDIGAEFKTDMREKEWKSKVRTLCYEYEKAGGVILLNPKKQFKFETDLLGEFSRYQLKAFKDSVLIRFASEEKGGKKAQVLFNDINIRTQKGNRSLIYLIYFRDDDFKAFFDEAAKLKRKGYRFFSFSDILKRRQKTEPPVVTVKRAGE